MARKCTNCGHVIKDDRLIACPQCHQPFVTTGSNLIGTLTPPEVKEVVRRVSSKMLKFIFGGFSILTIVTVIILALSLYKAYNQGMLTVQDKITKRIDDEFKQPRITKTVEQAAKSQASNLLLEQINPQVAIFRSQVESGLAEIQHKSKRIDDILAQAQKNVDEVKQVSEFGLLVSRATNDDREAYDILLGIAKNRENIFSSIAAKVLDGLVNDTFFACYIRKISQWDKIGINLSTANIVDFKSIWVYYPSLSSNGQCSVLSEIWKLDRFSKNEKIQLTCDVMQMTKSVKVLKSACAILNKESHLGKNVLAYDLYLQWWQDHKPKMNSSE